MKSSSLVIVRIAEVGLGAAPDGLNASEELAQSAEILRREIQARGWRVELRANEEPASIEALEIEISRARLAEGRVEFVKQGRVLASFNLEDAAEHIGEYMHV